MAENGVLNLPVIDVAVLLEDGASEEAISGVDRQIYEACSQVGFFYCRNHGVDTGNMMEELDRFFALPEKVKESIHMSKSPEKSFWGYSQLGAETTLGMSDWHECIDFGPVHSNNSALPLQAPNLWLAEEILPGWRAALERYMDDASRVGDALLRSIMRGLGLPSDALEPHFQHPFTILRLLNYPPMPPKGTQSHGKEVGLGIGAHRDYGCLTLLYQDDVGGLEVQRRDGSWISAPPDPDCYIVNLGDMLMNFTGGRLVSTPHRVLNRTNRARRSIPFFYDPQLSAVIQPRPELSAAGQEMEPIHYGDYLYGKYAQSFVEHAGTDQQ
mmetsp:Transcript_14782/g.42064  ORF Transcript_14782/g.42064 Transcript_14782/m.42064 type:complete len:327 (+) Transcript_14782:70-1050(+)